MGRLLFIDSFDHYDTAHLAEKWSTNSGWRVGPTYGRNGAGIQGGGYSSVVKNLASNYNELIIGYAIQYATLTSYNGRPVGGISVTSTGSAPVVGLGVNSVGALIAWSGDNFSEISTVLGSSANALVQPGIFYYFEMHFNLSAGTIVAHLNGVEVLTLSDLTFSNATVNQMLAHDGINGGMQIDDVYVLDPSDAPTNVYDQAPSDFLGDVRVALAPVSGDGRLNNFGVTPTGAPNWEAVSDNPPDDDTSYTSSNNVGDIDLYAITPPLLNSILGVQLSALMRKDSAGTRLIELGVGNGTNEFYGSDRSLPSTYVYEADVYAKNPLTGLAWTAADLAALQLGVKVSG